MDGNHNIDHENENGHNPDQYQQLIDLIEDEAKHNAVSMNLSGRNLTKVPHEIGLAMSLERLGLSNNSITSLPPEFGRLISLQYLNLRSNSLREFPPVLTTLQSLEIIDLSRNKIKKFPSELGNLVNLKVLSVSKNRIQVIPTYFRSMKKLSVFKIEHNPIQWPPPNIVACPQDIPHEEWIETLRQYMENEVSNGIVVGENQQSSMPTNNGLQSQSQSKHVSRKSVSNNDKTNTDNQTNHPVRRSSRGDASNNNSNNNNNNQNDIDTHINNNNTPSSSLSKNHRDNNNNNNSNQDYSISLGKITGASEQSNYCMSLLNKLLSEYDSQTLQWVEIIESSTVLLDKIVDANNHINEKNLSEEKLASMFDSYILSLAADTENIIGLQTALTGLDREKRFLDSSVTACNAFVTYHKSLANILEDYLLTARKAQHESRAGHPSHHHDKPLSKFSTMESSASLLSNATASYSGALRAFSQTSLFDTINNDNGNFSQSPNNVANIVSQTADSLYKELGDLGRAITVLETSILDSLDTIKSGTVDCTNSVPSSPLLSIASNNNNNNNSTTVKLPSWTKLVRSALSACVVRTKRLTVSFLSTIDSLCNVLGDRQIRELVRNVFDTSSDLALSVVWANYSNTGNLSVDSDDFNIVNNNEINTDLYSTNNNSNSSGNGSNNSNENTNINSDNKEKIDKLQKLSYSVSRNALELVDLVNLDETLQNDKEFIEMIDKVGVAANQLKISDDQTNNNRVIVENINKFIKSITRMTSQARQHSIKYQPLNKDIVIKLQEVTRGTKELALSVGDLAKTKLGPSSSS